MNVLVADDHPIMRIGIRQLVEAAWPQASVVEAETAEQACIECSTRLPDVIVLDLMLPDTTGTEGVARVLRAAPGVPILVLSFAAESAFAARLLKMGVAGFLPKDRAGDELVIALRTVLEGRRYVTPATADRLVDLVGGRGDSDKEPHELLSAQEHRVMQMIAAGKTPAQMAELMQVSVKTVGTYRARILEKTGWKSTAELTRYCVQHGLVDGE